MENDERWKELCSQAAVEQDPVKLMELVNEVNRLFTEKEAREKANRARNEHQETDTNIKPGYVRPAPANLPQRNP